MKKSEALKEIGEGLARVAAALLVYAEEGEETETVVVKEEKARPDEPKAVEEKTEEPRPVKTTEKKYTLEDVRKELSAKSGAGFTEEVRALLEKHGGSKLSAIDTAEYAAIMEEVKSIGSAQ